MYATLGCYTIIGAQQQAGDDEFASEFRTPKPLPSRDGVRGKLQHSRLSTTTTQQLDPNYIRVNQTMHPGASATCGKRVCTTPGRFGDLVCTPCRPPKPRQTLGHIKRQIRMQVVALEIKRPRHLRFVVVVTIISTEQLHSSSLLPRVVSLSSVFSWLLLVTISQLFSILLPANHNNTA